MEAASPSPVKLGRPLHKTWDSGAAGLDEMLETMRLRDALDHCTDKHADDWVVIPGERPATAMVAGHFDPGPEDMRVRSLVGHTIAVYEPDASLSLVWHVPEDDEVRARGRHSDDFPQWAADDLAWDSAHLGYVVVLLSGSPIWQEPLWLLDWGSGTAGYVAAFEPIYSQDRVAGEALRLEGWEASAWSVGVARLLNELSITGDFHGVDPTDRIVPERSTRHPIEASRARLR